MQIVGSVPSSTIKSFYENDEKEETIMLNWHCEKEWIINASVFSAQQKKTRKQS